MIEIDLMSVFRRKKDDEVVVLRDAVQDDGVEREVSVLNLLLLEHLAVPVLDLCDCLAVLHLEVEDGKAFVLVGREVAGEKIDQPVGVTLLGDELGAVREQEVSEDRRPTGVAVPVNCGRVLRISCLVSM